MRSSYFAKGNVRCLVPSSYCHSDLHYTLFLVSNCLMSTELSLTINLNFLYWSCHCFSFFPLPEMHHLPLWERIFHGNYNSKWEYEYEASMSCSLSFKHPLMIANGEIDICLFFCNILGNGTVSVMSSLTLFSSAVTNYRESNDKDEWQPWL